MAETLYLASTLLMGLLIVGVVAMVLRGRRWHHYAPQAAYGELSAGGGNPGSMVGRIARTPSVWTATFVMLVLGFMGGVIVFLGDGPSFTGPVLMGALGLVVVGYLVGGLYFAMRERDRPYAQAVGASIMALGALFLLGLALKLVLA